MATKMSSGAQQQHVHVVERQLLPVHEHIIVGLPGLWAVTSPDSAALRAHFFLRVRTLLCMSGCNYVVSPIHPKSPLLHAWPGRTMQCAAFCTVGGRFQLSSEAK